MMTLLPHHEAMIIASAISPEVAAARGYRSVERRSELEHLGFGRQQSNVPALLIPVWNVHGQHGTYQSRPDAPRVKHGKPLKYETPAGTRMMLDVPPLARPWLADPHLPLFITEGARKADAAVSVGLCCIAVLGVWNWRGANEHGGKVALPDWEAVALNGREVMLCFDSDVMLKLAVHQALVRVKSFLETRGACVRLIYLPPGEGGRKTGLDDFLAAGHTVEDLLALATDALRAPPHDADDDTDAVPYLETPNGLLWRKPTANGWALVPLTNFTARIVADVVEDDGSGELRHVFEMEARRAGRTSRFTLPAERFAAMSWPVDHLGASAIIHPGTGTRDHARVAMQLLSGEPPEQRVFTHLGWRQWGEGDAPQWVYLHAGGAIGPDGPIPGVIVRLSSPLDRYVLPEPPVGEALVAAVRASLGMLEVAPDAITMPLYGALWRAVLGGVDHSLALIGPTGAGKSELAALVQQHFGAGLDARHLPGAWSSTSNALEATAFVVKDAVFTIDDFAPGGTSADVQRLHREADRLIRAQGNLSGRQRMRADTTLRPARHPRGLLLITGEDVPRGQSLRGRMMVVEVGPDSLRWDRLTACQRDAADGMYAAVLAGFVQWLAPRHAEVMARLRERLVELRQRALASGIHRRTPEIVANLAIGWTLILSFALDSGALTDAEATTLDGRAWAALGGAAAAQAEHQSGSEPATRFLELVHAAIAGGLAHVSGMHGDERMGEHSPAAWGWQERGQDDGTWWQPGGPCVGWVEGDDLYLEPDTAFAVVQRLGRDQGEGLAVTSKTLHKRLSERRLLASTDRSRGRLTVRKVIADQRRTVLHLSVRVFLAPESAQSAQSPQTAAGSGEADLRGGEDGPVSWADHRTSATESARQIGPSRPQAESATDGRGTNGPIGPLSGNTTQPQPPGEGDARCSASTGHPPFDVLWSRAAASAARHGWPRVGLRPGVAVMAGEEAWARFLARAGADDLAAACIALDRMDTAA